MNSWKKSLNKNKFIIIIAIIVIAIIITVIVTHTTGKHKPTCNNNFGLKNPLRFPNLVNNVETRALGLRGMVNFPGKEPNICNKLEYPSFQAAINFCDTNKNKCAGIMIEKVNNTQKYYVIFDYNEYAGWKDAVTKDRNVHTYIFVSAGNFKDIGEGQVGSIQCNDRRDCPAVYKGTPTFLAGDNKTACRALDSQGNLLDRTCVSSDNNNCMCAPPVDNTDPTYYNLNIQNVEWPWWATGCIGDDCWGWPYWNNWSHCDDDCCGHECPPHSHPPHSHPSGSVPSGSVPSGSVPSGSVPSFSIPSISLSPIPKVSLPVSPPSIPVEPIPKVSLPVSPPSISLSPIPKVSLPVLPPSIPVEPIPKVSLPVSPPSIPVEPIITPKNILNMKSKSPPFLKRTDPSIKDALKPPIHPPNIPSGLNQNKLPQPLRAPTQPNAKFGMDTGKIIPRNIPRNIRGGKGKEYFTNPYLGYDREDDIDYTNYMETDYIIGYDTPDGETYVEDISYVRRQPRNWMNWWSDNFAKVKNQIQVKDPTPPQQDQKPKVPPGDQKPKVPPGDQKPKVPPGDQKQPPRRR